MILQESAIVFPLRSGKRLDLAKFVKTLSEERAEEHAQTHKSIVSESWFLQPTPQGDLVVVYLRAPDPMEVFVDLAVSEEPFAVWFRDQVLELSGMDLNMLPPFNLSQRIFHRIRRGIESDY